MIWLADENFNGGIVWGLRRKLPSINILRAQDLEDVRGKDDVNLLAWAAKNGRVVLTHDASTMRPAVQSQFRRQGRCAPVVIVPSDMPIASVIDEIALLETCGSAADFAATMIYLPL